MGQVTPDHGPDDVGRSDLRDRSRQGDLSVLEHGHPVGQGENLVEVVSDEDDTDSALLQIPDHVVEELDLGD